MRKITRDIVKAFINGETRTIGNSSCNSTSLLLHNNKIAWREKDGTIKACLCGWGTPTTRERLNGLCVELGVVGVFSQKDHGQHFNGHSIGTLDVVTLRSA